MMAGESNPRKKPQVLEVKSPPRLVTDFEVYNFLKEMKSAQQRDTPTPLATITYEMLRFLDGGPSAKQTQTQVERAIAAFSELPANLPMSTILELVNNPPMNVLECQVIMGEKIYKMSDQDIGRVVQLSKDIFGD